MKSYPISNKKDIEKIEMILKSENKRDYVMWVLGTNTGLRISDILKLKKEQVQGDFIEVVEQKTGKKRTIKINKKLKTALKDYLKTIRDNGYLFPSRVGGGNRAITYRRAEQIIKRAVKLAGVDKNINIYSMRKTYALNIYRATGNNIALVMAFLNINTEIEVLKYLCLVDEELNNATELIADM